jgi:glycerophosphoryl diester phosphodiesterase
MPMVQLPPLIAHRGDRRYAPENTLAAFRQAKAKGALWLELDATLTRDTEQPVVVFHDDTVGRTTNLRNQPISQVGFAELRAADAGHWFSDAYDGERVPTLAESMTLADKLGLGLNIEIKVSGSGSPLSAGNPEPYDPQLAALTARRVIEDVRTVRSGNWNNILLSSFSVVALETVKQLAPEAPFGYLVHEHTPEDGYNESWPEFCAHLNKLRPATLNLNHELLPSRERYAQFRAVMQRTLGQVLPVLAYTVNDAHRARALYDWGITSLFTDAPGDLGAALQAQNEANFDPENGANPPPKSSGAEHE